MHRVDCLMAKWMEKVVGLCPTPRKLLKKFEQNFSLNRANARFTMGSRGLVPLRVRAEPAVLPLLFPNQTARNPCRLIWKNKISVKK
jgi:hypothetical protein